jgi:hypothetical protein
MTFEEMEALMAVIKTAYPEFYSDYSDTDAATALWARVLGEYSVETVTAAVMKHIGTCKFAPKISEIKELAIQLRPGGKHGLPTKKEIIRMQRNLERIRREEIVEVRIPLLEGRK